MSKPGDLVRQGMARELAPPYPAIPDTEVALLERFLRLVWDEARAPVAVDRHQVNFTTGAEEEISFALAKTIQWIRLSESVLVQSFFGAFRSNPAEPKLENFNRSSINRKCDFLFSRAVCAMGSHESLNGMFVEAKLVTADKAMGNYVGGGLMRFVTGQYAWAMPQGMLLAYVRETTQSLPDSLAAYYARESGKKAKEIRLIAGPKAFAKSLKATRMHWSSHARALVHDLSGNPLGDICVYHLWLDVHA
jgi:hypothetical protein